MDKYSDLCKRMGIPAPTREHYAGGGHVAHKERSEHHEKHHERHESKHREKKSFGGNAGSMYGSSSITGGPGTYPGSMSKSKPIGFAGGPGSIARRAPMMPPSPEATMPMKKGGIADAIMGKKNQSFMKHGGRSHKKHMDEGGLAEQMGPKTKAGVPIRVAKSMPKPVGIALKGAVPMSAAHIKMSRAMRKGGKCHKGEE